MVVNKNVFNVSDPLKMLNALWAEIEKYKDDFLTKPMKYGMINLVENYNNPRIISEKERIK